MRLSYLALSVVVLAACASVPSDGVASLDQRATQRWALLVKGDLEGAYGFLSPATREITSFERYRSGIKLGMWRGAEVGEVVCSTSEICSVKVDVSYTYKPKFGSSAHERVLSLPETWKKDGGQWWYVPD